MIFQCTKLYFPYSSFLLLTGFSVLFKTLALPVFSSIPSARNRFQLSHPLFCLLASDLYLIVLSMSVLVFLDINIYFPYNVLYFQGSKGAINSKVSHYPKPPFSIELTSLRGPYVRAPIFQRVLSRDRQTTARDGTQYGPQMPAANSKKSTNSCSSQSQVNINTIPIKLFVLDYE